MSKPLNEYALYKGDDLLAVGTVEEIAEHMNVSIRTVWFYQTPTYKKRRKHNFRELVKLSEDETV